MRTFCVNATTIRRLPERRSASRSPVPRSISISRVHPLSQNKYGIKQRWLFPDGQVLRWYKTQRHRRQGVDRVTLAVGNIYKRVVMFLPRLLSICNYDSWSMAKKWNSCYFYAMLGNDRIRQIVSMSRIPVPSNNLRSASPLPDHLRPSSPSPARHHPHRSDSVTMSTLSGHQSNSSFDTRKKQSRKDEVCSSSSQHRRVINRCVGDSEKNRV
jgi:hypothetical protein